MVTTPVAVPIVLLSVSECLLPDWTIVRSVASIASLILACLGSFITAVLSLMVVTATDGAGLSDHLYFAGSHDVHRRHQTTVLGHEVIDVSGVIDEAVVDVLTNAVLNVRVLTLECLHEGEQDHFLHGNATLNDVHHGYQKLSLERAGLALVAVGHSEELVQCIGLAAHGGETTLLVQGVNSLHKAAPTDLGRQRLGHWSLDAGLEDRKQVLVQLPSPWGQVRVFLCLSGSYTYPSDTTCTSGLLCGSGSVRLEKLESRILLFFFI